LTISHIGASAVAQQLRVQCSSIGTSRSFPLPPPSSPLLLSPLPSLAVSALSAPAHVSARCTNCRPVTVAPTAKPDMLESILVSLLFLPLLAILVPVYDPRHHLTPPRSDTSRPRRVPRRSQTHGQSPAVAVIVVVVVIHNKHPRQRSIADGLTVLTSSRPFLAIC